MNADDKAESIAARIADGSAIDWPDGGTGPDDGLIDELRTIAALATLHRTPSDWPDDQSSTPARWGPLTLLGAIGEGRFGRVYRAWDARLHRQVALKLLRAPASAASDAPTHAIEEARLLARVRHPNVLTVYGAEALDGQVGIWTEFIEGHDLETRLAERGPLAPDEVLAIGIDLCRALGAVHTAGLLHRDIKTQNVMRETGGRIVLMDFGTGHDLESVAPRAGDLTGTPLYLAPEIFAGTPATAASDIYALAVLLHRLLYGRYPIEGRTLDDVRAGHAAGRSIGTAAVHTPLTAAIARGLAADPAQRFDSASGFEAALAPPPADHAALGRPARSAMWLAAGGAALAVAVAALVMDAARAPGATSSNGSPAGATASTVSRRLTPPRTNWPGRPSRDGRFQPYVDHPAGNLWFWELATGATHQVTQRVEGSSEAPASSAMSPDGSLIAYMWWTRDRAYELRVIHSDGTNPRVILAAGAADSPVPIEWSADGTQLMTRLEQKDGRVDLALIPVAGGDPYILQSFGRGQPRQVSLSPDGRTVVYDFPRDFDSMQSQLMMLDTTPGTSPRVLLDESANNLNPFWTPDGRSIFFTSDRSGSMEGWVVDVANGVAEGEPSLVARNLGGALPIALTSDDVFHYLLDTSDLEVFVLPVDGSRVPWTTGTPARVSPQVVGGHVGPAWSHDGRHLAFITRVPSSSLGLSLNRGANSITILDRSTGASRHLRPQLSTLNISPPRWSDDGRSVAVRGTSLDNQIGYFQVDVASGAVTPMLTVNAGSNEADYGAYRWSLDGQSLFFRHAPRGIVARHLATGTETTLVDWKANGLSNFAGFAVSPDDDAVAFGASRVQPGVTARAIFVQASGGPVREVFRVLPPELVVVQGWSPDGRNILFTRYRVGQVAATDPHHVWTVPADGGEAQDTGVRIPGFTQPYFIALSPDGKSLAYTTGQTASERWVMENFLPRQWR